jgi:hypothetical protein
MSVNENDPDCEKAIELEKDKEGKILNDLLDASILRVVISVKRLDIDNRPYHSSQ